MQQPILENNRVLLSPLTMENHRELINIAAQKKLVQYSPSEIETPKTLKNYVSVALQKKSEGKAIPFIVYDKKNKSFAGSSRYMNMDPMNKVLEIGSTWIGREFHGTGLNFAMKQVMIDHAFGTMGYEKIEFRIDERNMRSRKAVEKLGATLEGVLRQNVYLLNGFKRNTCCYGLLKEEWKYDG